MVISGKDQQLPRTIREVVNVNYAKSGRLLQWNLRRAKPTNPDDGSLEQQVQSLIDDPANKRLEKLKPSYVSSPVLNQTVKSGLASLV